MTRPRRELSFQQGRYPNRALADRRPALAHLFEFMIDEALGRGEKGSA
jgi:hypothetical protein